MRCFIHTDVEAIAACRKCGKGMCSNCSAYSGHTGICPECRRNEFILEAATKRNRVVALEKEIKWNIAKTVLLFWTLYFLFAGIYEHSKMKKELETLNQRIDVLDKEIIRLGNYMHTDGKEFK